MFYIFVLLIIICAIASFYTIIRLKRSFQNDLKQMNVAFMERGNTIEELNKTIGKLQEMVSIQSKLKAEFKERVVELEDGIKHSTGISLRREVTEVKSQFEMDELSTISQALPYLIREFFKSKEDVKLIMSLSAKVDLVMSKLADSTKGN